MKRHLPLHIHISSLFLILVLLVGGVIGIYGYRTSKAMLESSAKDLIERIDRETASELRNTIAPGEAAANLLSHSALPAGRSVKDRLESLALMREALKSSDALSSIYVGYDSGDFFFLRRLRNDADRQLFNAPERSAYLLQTIERGGRVPKGRYLYLDATLESLREDDKPEYPLNYDPRSRGWFKNALTSASQVKSAPYVFFSNKKVGMTLSVRSANGLAVVGADIQLDTLAGTLHNQKVTPGSQVALVNRDGYVVAHEDMANQTNLPTGPDGKPTLTHLKDTGIPVLAALADKVQSMVGDGAYMGTLPLAGDDWQVVVRPLIMDGAAPLFLVSAIPESELLASALKQRSTSVLITLAIILAAIPLTILLSRRISKPIRALVQEADMIRRFDFSHPIDIHSSIKEVSDLASTADVMKRTIQRFLDISDAVAGEENFDRLLPMLLSETLAAAEGEIGLLFLADNQEMVPAAALDREGKDLREPLHPLSLEELGPLLGEAIRGGLPCQGELGDKEAALTGLDQVLSGNAPRHALAVPLLNRRRQLVGALLLLHHTPIEPALVSFVKTLSGSAASSLETRELIKAQKELFEAFIQLIAGAIDAKSPYTGGHCARVPELTKMLARAACADKTGTFAEFDLSEQDWEAIHVASWLHDCGKVTTPEYVVDKATKLETIYDRIHEIRMRFEVLKRDAEIASLKAILAGTPEAEANATLSEEISRLDADFAFIAECNEGGEFMAPERVARLKEIAARTWTRTLSDRIGISYEERERKARTPEPTLPVVETLLADKPEHLFERRSQDHMPADNPWGFKVDVPELLYNKGEVYNLSVGRGTLSNEERYKINEHIVQTLIMLSQLPFPKHLRLVPEIAGGHHEKMDGSGYPRRLRKDEMSPVARMMAIADIFEALTAVDRPYKKGKTLSEAIKIMSFMKKDQHIDPELFELFLTSGAYREYAERFMKPEQIDEVDVASYLKKAA